MQNMPIGIFRGDDTDAFSYQTIVGTINTDLDLTGCKAVFRYLGFSAEFDPIPEDRKLTIVIPANETKKFPPGLGYASLRVYDSDGRLKTFSNRIMVFVATKTPMFGSDEFEVDFNVRASLEPLKFFVGPNPDDFDEYRGYLEKVIDRASAEKYGLAILLDAIDSDLGAGDGVAATPVAVKAAYAAIIKKLTDDYYTAAETDEAIDRVAAYYITYDAAGNPFPTRAALLNAQTYYSGGVARTPTRNDYAIVLADETHDNSEYRYIYAVAEGQTTGSWQAQYPVEGVLTIDQSVTKNSQNPVASSGIWSAIWGALSALPTGFASLYDWCVAQLGLKRDYTDLSYDTTETVEVPALHATMTAGGQTIVEYDLLCTEEVPDPPEINHVYTWNVDNGAFYVTQGRGALTTTWSLYSQGGELLDFVTTDNTEQGFYPDVLFTATGADVAIHKTTVQKIVTVEDELALKSGVPAPSSTTPAMDGVGAAGTSKAYARSDHVHPSDTGKVPTSRTVNGKALSSDVTLTGADLAVSGTDATTINAALAGKATKADATLTERFSAWTLSGDVEAGSQYEVRFDFDNEGTTLWGLYKDGNLFATGSDNPLSTSEDFPYGLEPDEYIISAMRTALQGYQLGDQELKPLASEAEAEALRVDVAEANAQTVVTDSSVVAKPYSLPDSAFPVTITVMGGGSYSYTAEEVMFSGNALVLNHSYATLCNFNAATGYFYSIGGGISSISFGGRAAEVGVYPRLNMEPRVVVRGVDVATLLDLKKIAPDWTSGSSYTKYDVVKYNGVYYYAKSATSGTTAPSSDTTHWSSLANLAALAHLFLPLTGDTMTGNLTFEDGHGKGVCFNRSGGYTSKILYDGASDTLEVLTTDSNDTVVSDIVIPTTGYGVLALTDNLPYALGTVQTISTASQDTSGTETIDYGAATMLDRTGNYVAITTALDELRVTFPPLVNGKMRDFLLRVEVGTGSAALTAPALVCVAPTGETITLENPDGTMPTIVDGTATAKGVTYLLFSESAVAGKFVVRGIELKEVA